MLADYREMIIKLGEPDASKRTADMMVNKLSITKT